VAQAERRGVTEALVLVVRGVLGVRRIHGITLHLIANLNRMQTCYLENSDGSMLELTEIYTNNGGYDGAPGRSGTQSYSRLEDGNNGPNGSVQIFIKEQNERVLGPFASPFQLELFDFEVIDSNEDGIFEFGEEIILRNIRARNSGSCPSGLIIDCRWYSVPKICRGYDDGGFVRLGFYHKLALSATPYLE
jgi:hypothetical protein